MAIYNFSRIYRICGGTDTDCEGLWVSATSEEMARRKLEYEYPDSVEFILTGVRDE